MIFFKFYFATLAALVFSLTFGANTFASGNFTQTRKDTVEVLDSSLYQNASDAKAKFELPLSFAKFENLQWTRSQVIDQVNYLANIYRQCSIRIGEVKIYRISSYKIPVEISFTQAEMPELGYESVAKNVSVTDRPLVFLVNKMLDNDHTTSFAVAAWKIFPLMKVHPAVLNTAWLVHPITSLEYEEREHPKCVNCVLAHELGHVLMRDNMHNGDRPPNLMSSAKMGERNNSLPPHICQEIQRNDLLKPVR